MMRVSLIRTVSAPNSAPHRTLFVHVCGLSLFVWVHAPQRPWLVRQRGVFCGGVVLLSFNIFTRGLYE